MIRNGFGLQVIVGGAALPEHTFNGKTYIAAPWGRDYSLRIVVPNRFGERWLAVGSVDGLDIMTGKTASPDGRGYVVTPPSRFGANDIPGFRLNNDEVARFRFGERSDSYAAQMDKPANIGVIGLVFFEERFSRVRGGFSMDDVTRGGGTRGGGMLGGGTRGGTRGGLESTSKGGHDMGTEFGARHEHRVSTTSFDRGAEIGRFVIEYASEESLRAQGIIVDSPLGHVDPFPADKGPGCTPPQGWRG